jgi:sugar/nucleoside kinase (ribokinase family)
MNSEMHVQVNPKHLSIGCVGMTTIDTLLCVNQLPDSHDDIQLLSSGWVCLGGKGMITALTLFELGCNVKLFTLTGERSSRQDELISLIPAAFIMDYVKPWLNKTSRVWLTISNEQKVHTIVEVGRLDRSWHEDMHQSVEGFLQSVDVLYLSCEDPTVIRCVLHAANLRSIPLIANLSLALLITLADGGEDILRTIVQTAHSLLMNESESRALLDLLQCETWFGMSDSGPQEVIITRGSSGGIMATRTNQDWVAFESEPVLHAQCAVGAGDTFNGAFIKARFVDGADLHRSCRYAASVAANKVQVQGSSPIILEL